MFVLLIRIGTVLSKRNHVKVCKCNFELAAMLDPTHAMCHIILVWFLCLQLVDKCLLGLQPAVWGKLQQRFDFLRNTNLKLPSALHDLCAFKKCHLPSCLCLLGTALNISAYSVSGVNLECFYSSESGTKEKKKKVQRVEEQKLR